MVDTAKDLTGRDMTGKVALVVGAGPGWAGPARSAFARDGADVVVSARRAEPLAELAAEIAAETGRRVEPIVSDLSDLDSLVALVDEAVERMGGIDALVTVATAGGGQIADRRGRLGHVAPRLPGQRHRHHGGEPVRGPLDGHPRRRFDRARQHLRHPLAAGPPGGLHRRPSRRP